MNTKPLFVTSEVSRTAITVGFGTGASSSRSKARLQILPLGDFETIDTTVTMRQDIKKGWTNNSDIMDQYS